MSTKPGADPAVLDDVRTGVSSLSLPIPQADIRFSRVDTDAQGGNMASSYGGLKLLDVGIFCTSGFSVSSSGADGVVDAAHCSNTGIQEEGNPTTLVFQDGNWGGNSDVQWFTTPSATDDNIIKDGSGTRVINDKVSRAGMTVGDPVCLYGAAGGYSCGTIKSRDYDPTGPCFDNHSYNPQFIRVSSASIAPGDSGGPAFWHHTAMGILKGNTCNSAEDPIFTAQNYLSNIGVSVKTT